VDVREESGVGDDAAVEHLDADVAAIGDALVMGDDHDRDPCWWRVSTEPDGMAVTCRGVRGARSEDDGRPAGHEPGDGDSLPLLRSSWWAARRAAPRGPKKLRAIEDRACSATDACIRRPRPRCRGRYWARPGRKCWARQYDAGGPQECDLAVARKMVATSVRSGGRCQCGPVAGAHRVAAGWSCLTRTGRRSPPVALRDAEAHAAQRGKPAAGWDTSCHGSAQGPGEGSVSGRPAGMA